MPDVDNEDVEAAQGLLEETKVDEEEGSLRAEPASDTLYRNRTATSSHQFYSPRPDWWFPIKTVVSLTLLLVFAVLSFIATQSGGLVHHHPTPKPPTTPTNGSTYSSTTDVSLAPAVTPTGLGESKQEINLASPGDRYILSPDWDYEESPKTREYHWTVTDVELNPDGVYRPMTVINGEFPGPLMEVNEGDTIVVHVHNKASNSTSIHWHGLFQNGTNHMDGTVGITQCPIAPATDFVYEFKVTGQSGTYWYHSHHAAQASDGLYGPVVIHSRQEAEIRKRLDIDYTTDRVIMVSDHYYDLSSALVYQYLQPDRENAEPVPASALINGRGIRNCGELPNRRCDTSMLSPPWPTLNLEAGKSHRLRLINAGAFAEFQIQLDEHQFAVTEADGTDLVPQVYHRLNVLPAQRYSIVVSANNTSRDAYWLRARMVEHCFKEVNPELVAELHTAVNYVHTAAREQDSVFAPESVDWPEPIELQCRDMNASELHPVLPTPPPQQADHTVYVRANFEIGAWRLSRAFFNASSWRANMTSPSLFRFLDGANAGDVSYTQPFAFGADADDALGASLGNEIAVPAEPAGAGVNDIAFDPNAGELVYQTRGPAPRVVDVLVSNFDDGAHPFHLHGHKFWVLAGGKGYPPEGLAAPSNLNYGLGAEFPGTGPSHAPKTPHGINLEDPLYRDTATVEGFGWALLRFVADNPGMWAFHCHVSWHTEAGLLMQFLVMSDELQKLEVPQRMRDMCKAANVESGRRPDDSIWYGSFPDRE